MVELNELDFKLRNLIKFKVDNRTQNSINSVLKKFMGKSKEDQLRSIFLTGLFFVEQKLDEGNLQLYFKPYSQRLSRIVFIEESIKKEDKTNG